MVEIQFCSVIDSLLVCPVDLMQPGVTIIFRNAKIDMFKGSMRLAVDKWGRVEVTDPADFTVKEDNNLSLVEYELVSVVDEWWRPDGNASSHWRWTVKFIWGWVLLIPDIMLVL